MIYIINIVEEANIFNNIIRTFLGFLCKIIYPMIINAWDLFMALAKTQIFKSSLDSSGIVSLLYTRVGLLLGLLMLFKVIFSLIQMLINPDLLTDKDKGIFNIIKRSFIVIALLAFVPTIFSFAFKMQEVVLDENTIGNIIFGKKSDLKDFGNLFSTNIFQMFYIYDSRLPEQNGCLAYELTLAELRDYESLDLIDECLYETFTYDYNMSNSSSASSTFTKELYKIDFTLNGILAVVVGAFILYMLIIYSIYLGARIVQLALLQILAPVPIISYISPSKNDSLQKWAKLCLSTFLDMFIRLAIIYFVSLIIYVLLGNSGSEGAVLVEETSEATGTLLIFVKISIILGSLVIAKKFPDIIGEIFPSLGIGKGGLGFGLSWKKLTDSMVGGNFIREFPKRGIGGVAGGVFGGAIGFLGGRGLGRFSNLAGGIFRGMKNGSQKGGFLKNMAEVGKKQSEMNSKKIDWYNSGSRFGGRLSQRASNVFGFKGNAEIFENQIQSHQDVIDKKKKPQQSYSKISEYKKSFESRAESKLLNAKFNEGTIEANLQRDVLEAKARMDAILRRSPEENRGRSEQQIAAEIASAQQQYNSKLKAAKEQYINGALSGAINDGVILEYKKNLQNTIRANQEDFSEIAESRSDFSTFDQIDSLEQVTSEKAGELQREIEIEEVQISNIESNPDYQKAKADRDAVGGHHGNKGGK